MKEAVLTEAPTYSDPARVAALVALAESLGAKEVRAEWFVYPPSFWPEFRVSFKDNDSTFESGAAIESRQMFEILMPLFEGAVRWHFANKDDD